MKRRVKIKRWNREVREFKLSLKREKQYSHDSLFKSYEYYDGEFSWSDIYFIGTYEGRERLFNCTIVSSLDEFDETITDIIYDRYPDEIDDKPIKKRMLDSGEIFVRSYVETVPDYRYGIGLHIVTEEKYLNRDIVLDYVRKIQMMNLNGFNKIFLSDKEFRYTQKEIEEQYTNVRGLISWEN